MGKDLSAVESIRCPLCSSMRVVAQPDIAMIVRSVYQGSMVSKCSDCGVGFVAPLPRAVAVDDVYGEEYFNAYASAGIDMPAAPARPPERYLRRLFSVQARTGTGHLLDIGPGNGAFLNYARSAGWTVMGIEPSKYAAEAAAKRYRLDIRCERLESAEFGENRFDVVHMSHVLEHFVDPVASLRIVAGVLKPGGTVIVEVPHELESLQFRVLKTLRMLRPYKVKCTHTFFFTPATLKRVLEKAGFREIVIDTVRDFEGGSGVRQLIRHAAASLERPFGSAPLIEAIAVK